MPLKELLSRPAVNVQCDLCAFLDDSQILPAALGFDKGIAELADERAFWNFYGVVSES